MPSADEGRICGAAGSDQAISLIFIQIGPNRKCWGSLNPPFQCPNVKLSESPSRAGGLPKPGPRTLLYSYLCEMILDGKIVLPTPLSPVLGREANLINQFLARDPERVSPEYQNNERGIVCHQLLDSTICIF